MALALPRRLALAALDLLGDGKAFGRSSPERASKVIRAALPPAQRVFGVEHAERAGTQLVADVHRTESPQPLDREALDGEADDDVRVRRGARMRRDLDPPSRESCGDDLCELMRAE